MSFPPPSGTLHQSAKLNIKGCIKSITFHSLQNGFTVMRLNDLESKKVVVVTGTFPALQPGESIAIEGEWGSHPKYGKQFQATSFEYLATDDNDIVEYLASGQFPGVGQKIAERIVEALGEATADILDNDPDKFREIKIKGFPAKKVELFLARWQEARHSRETMLFLYKHEIVGSVAKRLWNKFGQATIERITQNPYMLCEEVWGIGFLKADEIAQKVGFPKDSPERFQAALLYSLQEASVSDGHVYLPKNVLLERTVKNLRLQLDDDEAINILLDEFEKASETGRIKREGDDCYFPPLYNAEQRIADNIKLRLRYNTLETNNFENDLAKWEREHQFSFDPIQRRAIQMALSRKISIITGGPGTGKTTILKGILYLARQMEECVSLVAPTGRAAKRMGECCGEKARTIHRLLEVDPISGKFHRDADNRLQCNLLIVDEFSMVDTWLAASLLEATPLNARIVLVGDADQLPSVGAGNVLNDLLHCTQIPSTRLQHIFRQAGGNDIADKAAKINQGICPSPIEGTNFHFLPYETTDEAKDIIARLVTFGIREKLDIDTQTEMQLLSPMRKGPLGIYELNTFLQDLLNPNKERIKIASGNWSVGDRVMQTRNNYDKNVFNGDVGIIYKIGKDSKKITVFYDDKTVDYEPDEVEELMLAYASPSTRAKAANTLPSLSFSIRATALCCSATSSTQPSRVRKATSGFYRLPAHSTKRCATTAAQGVTRNSPRS